MLQRMFKPVMDLWEREKDDIKEYVCLLLYWVGLMTGLGILFHFLGGGGNDNDSHDL